MIPNERKLYLDIDVKKIRAAIHEAQKTGRANGEIFGNKWMGWSQYTTLLYSIRAHSRGKQHMLKQWVPDHGPEGRQKLVTRTMDDQAKLIGEHWKAFKWVPPTPAPEVQPAA